MEGFGRCRTAEWPFSPKMTVPYTYTRHAKIDDFDYFRTPEFTDFTDF